MSQPSARRALVSVSDKSELAPFIQELVQLGFEIVSTGGTRRELVEHGISVIDISEYTEFPEIMDGRVKTLHPRVHGAILGRPDHADDAAAISAHGIVPFDVVVCNLYPFEQTIASSDVTVSEAIEQIDIGGPSMVRSAAKNHQYVAVVTAPSQYKQVLERLKSGTLDADMRRRLAVEAFRMTARYDAAITAWFDQLPADSDDASDAPSAFPSQATLRLTRRLELRYGENPHQRAAFYVESTPPPGTLASAEQLHGKDLSWNNLLDLDAAMGVVREFSEPAVSVIKHNNPCGCAVATTPAEAFVKAWIGDPVSAFGSIVAFNRPVDAAAADVLCEPGRFIEAIIAAGFSADAIEAITTRPTWKANVRLMQCDSGSADHNPSLAYRQVTGGMLVQDRDERPDPEDEWKTVTTRVPSEAEFADLRMAWMVCRHVKSNAILFAKDGAVVGVGAGQMNRLDSVFMAAHKAGERSRGAVLASDAFFPFRDGIDEAAGAGITAVIQPGGSKRDSEVTQACNEHGMAMVVTGRRHFRH